MHLVFWISMETNLLAVLKVLFFKCYCLAFMKMLLQRKVLLRQKNSKWVKWNSEQMDKEPIQWINGN